MESDPSISKNKKQVPKLIDFNPPIMEKNEVGMVVQWHKHQQLLKRTLVFLVSVSVFSMFVWLSSGLSVLPNSFNVYFNTCLLSSILTHTLQRKYMFLICNGILAFLAKTSGFCYYVSASPNSYSLLPPIEYPQLSLAPSLYSSPKPSLTSDQQLQLATSIDEQEHEHEDEDGKKGEIEQENDDDDDDDDDSKGSEEEVVSTEELNRRIEEFIRKMKQDIRIEAQQQLIAV